MHSPCAGCKEPIRDGQALIALERHWHVYCFRCTKCRAPLHGEYVARDGKAYCEKDYQRLFGVTCVYCKRYITGKVLQAGEAHHFHPSCARCSKCGDPFTPGEEMYMQGEVTWHPRCGPGPDNVIGPPPLQAGPPDTELDSVMSRSASPFSFVSRHTQARAPSPYADSVAQGGAGDLSRVYTASYLNCSDPAQNYLKGPLEPRPPAKSPQFSRPASALRSRSSSRGPYGTQSSLGVGAGAGGRRTTGGMYSVLSGMRSGAGSGRARSPSMMNEEAIQMAAYPAGQPPSPDAVPKIERDDFPAPPFPYQGRRSGGSGGGQERASRARARSRDLAGKPSNGALNGISGEGDARGRRQRQQQQRQQNGRARSQPGPNQHLADADGHLEPDESADAEDKDYQDEDEEEQEEEGDDDDQFSLGAEADPQLRKEEEELSKIANGIGKVFLQTLRERERLRAWKRANLDPRNASRTPSAQRELRSRPLRYENPRNASPSRDLDRPRVWDTSGAGAGAGPDEHALGAAGSELASESGAAGSGSGPLNYGYKVVQSNRWMPRAPARSGSAISNRAISTSHLVDGGASEISFSQQQRIAQNRSATLLAQATPQPSQNQHPSQHQHLHHHYNSNNHSSNHNQQQYQRSQTLSRGSGKFGAAHLRRSMPNVSHLQHLHQEGPPKLYPYHLLATSNYRLPPDVDRCHLERHLSNEEFAYIFHCDRLDFYRLPEWKRNELKRRAKLF